MWNLKYSYEISILGKLVVNLKARTRLAGVPTIIVADATKPVSVTTLLEDNNEKDSIRRVIKLVSLDYYNWNREKLSS